MKLTRSWKAVLAAALVIGGSAALGAADDPAQSGAATATVSHAPPESVPRRLHRATEAAGRAAKRAAAATYRGIHTAVAATKHGLEKAEKALERAAAKTKEVLGGDSP